MTGTNTEAGNIAGADTEADEGSSSASLGAAADTSGANEGGGIAMQTGADDEEESLCAICGAEEAPEGTGDKDDWWSCSECETWVHAACAKRTQQRARGHNFRCAGCR